MNALLYQCAVFILFLFTIYTTDAQTLPDSISSYLATPDNQRKEAEYALEAASYYFTKDTVKTKVYLNRAVSIARQNHWQDLLGTANRYFGIMYYFAKKYEDSEKHYLKAVSNFGSINDAINQGKSHDGLGSLYLNHYHYNQLALTHFLKAWELRKPMNEGLHKNAHSLFNIAAAYLILEQYNDALSYLYNSMELQIEAHDSLRLAITKHHLGVCYRYLNNPEKSYAFLQEAVVINERLNQIRELHKNYHSLANWYISDGQLDRAIVYYKLLEKAYRDINEPIALAKVYKNMARSYLELGLLKPCYNYAQKAMKLFTIHEEVPGKIATLLVLADWAQEQEAYSKSRWYIKKALNYPKNLFLNEEVIAAYETQIINLQHLGQYKDAFAAYETLYSFRDSLERETNRQKIKEIEASFESRQLKQEIALIRETQKNTLLERETAEFRSYIYFGLFLIALILLLVAIGMLYKKQQLQHNLMATGARHEQELIRKAADLRESQKRIVEMQQYRDMIVEKLFNALSTPLKEIEDISKSLIQEYETDPILEDELNLIRRHNKRIHELLESLSGVSVNDLEQTFETFSAIDLANLLSEQGVLLYQTFKNHLRQAILTYLLNRPKINCVLSLAN